MVSDHARPFGTKTDRVYRALRRMIVSVELAPGAMINKDHLTQHFAVSRAPLNDALGRLRDEGLVNIAPQHGSFVQTVSLDVLREGVFLRRAVEPMAMRRLAPEIDAKTLGALHANLDKQKSAVEAGDLSALHALDDAFHGILLERAQLTSTLRHIRTFSAHLERARNLAKVTQRQPQETFDEHSQLVRALEARDGQWAASAMDVHLASALTPVMAQAEAHPELFGGDGALAQPVQG